MPGVDLKIKRLEANPSDDEDLASVFFEFTDGGYFTVCRSPDDDAAYFEHNDQSLSAYSNDFTFRVGPSAIAFRLEKSLAVELRMPATFAIVWPGLKVSVRPIEEAMVRIAGGRAAPGGSKRVAGKPKAAKKSLDRTRPAKRKR